jgi:ATP-binding cassette subfamily C (CFTR/MRP) protein 1
MFTTEKRQLPQPISAHSISTTSTSGIELCTLSKSPHTQKEVVVSLHDVRFGWKFASPPDMPGITLQIKSSPSGTVVILVGPVGCGKSTFLKGLVGETLVLEGELFMKYPDLAFCNETPWLSNTSIRNNIVGEDPSAFDSDWYRTVISACALDHDLKNMAAGDETSVGSKGSKLSGGQRQRIVGCLIISCFYRPCIDFLACIVYRASCLCSQTHCLLRRCSEWLRQFNCQACL